ncbi:MAG: PKD domain-containing protein [Bacteroidetes bacterium]|nr:PKD domain-containing protein [Bacteroidota bacterium]
MAKSIRILFFSFLFVLISAEGFSQTCGPTTPSFTVNLTGNPSGSWISPVVVRQDTCCGATAPDRCVEFWVILDPAAQGITFSIASGAIPPGALYYEVNCKNPTAVGDTMCLNGIGPHHITFCKPGNNNNTYEITSIAAPSAGPPTVVSQGCTGMIFASGYNESSLSWTSVFPGPVGAYNLYLSCDTACDTVIVTAQPGYPPYVLYQVCGYPIGGCGLMLICDTVQVDFVSNKGATIIPQNPTICFGGPPATITAVGSGGAPPYSYVWSTGATTQSIVVGVGTYWVQISDTTNCPPVYDTVTVTSYTANITASAGPDDTVCVYNPVFNLNGNVTGVTTGIWTNGNGTYNPSDTVLNSTYTPSAGEISNGTVTLILITTYTGGCPPDSDTLVLVIAPPPAAAFSNTTVCFGNPTQFTDNSTVPFGSITGWTWNFGDGNSSSLQNPSHTYTASGTYTASLIVGTSYGCIDTIQKTVVVNPAPTAAFTSTAQCFIDSVYFTDNSTISSGNITGWSWNFGDPLSAPNNTSSLQNPSHGYTSAGTFTVTLIVNSSSGCADTISQVITVQPSPLANFSATQVCFGNTTFFSDSSSISSGTITGWSWNFGDPLSAPNNTSSLQNPSHNFTSAGTFTVTLIVTSNTGCTDTILLPVIVNALPIANFSAGTVCAGSATTFTDLSTGNPTSWSWNFGDATTSALQNPSHNYASAGTYTVTLIVGTSFGCSDTISQIITVNPTPTAAFSNTAQCFIDSVFFTDNSSISSGNINGWSWNFGDPASGGNNFSNLQNPPHYYGASGNYTVTLVVTSGFGCTDTLTQTIFVAPGPLANFGSMDVCLGNQTFFNDSSFIPYGNIVSWNWNFGDATFGSAQNPSHNYSSPGTYNVTLLVTSDLGCTDTITKQVIVHPLPNAVITSSGFCVADGTIFYDGSTILPPDSIVQWFWDFGDGNNSTLQNPIHYFPSSGNYGVTLIVTSNFGCSDTIAQVIGVSPSPTAAFTENPTIVFLNQNVTFTDQSQSGIVLWYWNFGDGSSSVLQNPTHSYSVGGIYSVWEVVTNQFGCTDTIWHEVIVNNPPNIPTGFTPNGDGHNDILYVLGGPYIKLEFRIYNNWGELIFISTDQKFGWDGTRNGIKQPIGVYIYIINATTEDKKEHFIKGDVTLLR